MRTKLLAVGAFGVLAAVGTASHAGVHFQPVLSGSMRPGVQPGDLAVTVEADASAVAVGDVLALVPPGEQTPRLHRVVSLGPAGVVTRGDANGADDPGPLTIRGTEVHRLAVVVPKLGYLRNLRSVLLILSGLLFAGIAINSLKGGKDETSSSTPGNDGTLDESLHHAGSDSIVH